MFDRALIHLCSYRSGHRRWFIKKSILKNFAIFSGKNLCWSLFLIKLQVFRSATLLKRYSNTGVFLLILRNFQEQLFWITSARGCFCSYSTKELHAAKIYLFTLLYKHGRYQYIDSSFFSFSMKIKRKTNKNKESYQNTNKNLDISYSQFLGLSNNEWVFRTPP